ncbi:uncharacterized protein LOC111101258 [Crassostrea virginica]
MMKLCPCCDFPTMLLCDSNCFIAFILCYRSDAGESGADAAVAVIVTVTLLIIIIVVLVVLYKRNQFGLRDKMQPYIAVITDLFKCNEPQQGGRVPEIPLQLVHPVLCKEDIKAKSDTASDMPLKTLHPGLHKQHIKDQNIMAEIKFSVKAKSIKDNLIFKCLIMYISTCLRSPTETWTEINSEKCLGKASVELQSREEKRKCIDFVKEMRTDPLFAEDVHKSTLQMFQTVSSVQERYNIFIRLDVPEGCVKLTFYFFDKENIKMFLEDLCKEDNEFKEIFSRIILNSSILKLFGAEHLSWNVEKVKGFIAGKLVDERRINLKGDPLDFEENDVQAQP